MKQHRSFELGISCDQFQSSEPCTMSHSDRSRYQTIGIHLDSSRSTRLSCVARADGPGHSNGSGHVQFSAQPTLVGTFVRSLQYVSTSDAYSTVSSLCSTSISTFSSNSLDSSSSNLRHFLATSTEHSCFSTFSTLSSHSTLSTDSSSAQQSFTPLFWLSFGFHSGLYEHSHVFHTRSHLHL